MRETRECPDCCGAGWLNCEDCLGCSYLPCRCECGDLHDRECETCHGTGAVTCFCGGSGVVTVSDAEREAAGQLNVLGEA